jgi:L-seryl-tRNA(Ser) seleniumtransferase
MSRIESNGRQRAENGDMSLRSLPSVDRILAHATMDKVKAALPAGLVTEAVRETVGEARRAIAEGAGADVSVESLAAVASDRAWLMLAPSLRPVINATGVIIHTNLGRAPLSKASLDAITNTSGYSNLEYDLAKGERGSRYAHAVQILRRLVGCEDALVVNNNAAALVLVLTCLSSRREAILSRGQSVEIGGGFRIPEIMKTSGARLVEVGTTNRTYARDYEDAVTSETALLMNIHASNFRIVGFTSQPTVQELAEVAHKQGLLLVDDIGSGALLDTTKFGLQAEPMPQSSLASGADIVIFSGDKLLGGPQCGVIVGKTAIIAQLKKHPLTRALRVDKLTLAALEATLLHYLKGEAEREVPVWRMISATQEELRAKSAGWALELRNQGIACELAPGNSTIGGGSLPGENLPTFLLTIKLNETSAGEKAASLQKQPVPVIARIERGSLIIDPRTVLAGQERDLLAGLKRVLVS